MRRRLVVGGMLAALLVSVMAAMPSAAAATSGTGSYIVVLKDTASPSTMARVHAGRYGARVGHVYQHALKGYSATLSSDRVAALKADPNVAAVVWLRQVVLDALPDAREVVYRGWHGLGYHHPEAGYLCAVFPRAGDVLLGFERGVLLDDPHGLLSGEGRTVRYVRVEVPGDPPAERLVELIDAAVLVGTAGRRDPPRPGA